MKNFLLLSNRPFVLVLLLVFCLNADAVTGNMKTRDRNALNTKKIWDTIQNHETAILKEYSEFLSLPDGSSDKENIRRNAAFLLSMLQKRGVEARLFEEEGSPPVIYGELAAPRARKTILFYAHYDGQPANPSQWKTNPWKAILRDNPLEEGGTEVPLDSAQGNKNDEWRLYARSASDDKAPIMTLLAALDVLKANDISLSVNVKLVFEGEEEAGSPHLGSILEENKDSLRSDGMLLCDGPVHQTRRMQILFGARGTVDLEITVYGPSRALHSGHYGNWAPNPAAVMANLLAGLRDADGKILIPGFYDEVRPLTAAEKKAITDSPRVDEQLRKSLQLGRSEANNSRLEERIMLPALNIRGLRSGAVGPEAQNAVPTEASASIDFRLVPDQTPATVRQKVETHFISQGYHIVHETPDKDTRLRYPKVIKLEWGSGYPPSRTAMDIPFSRALTGVLEEGMEQALIKLPSTGGSVPLYLFADWLKLPVILFPIANHDNNQHGPNENIRLRNLWNGVEMFAIILANIGDRWK
jgi:acetylornithine deacetylase/succinyl-diaminopimelate desuccinylase-like protein